MRHVLQKAIFGSSVVMLIMLGLMSMVMPAVAAAGGSTLTFKPVIGNQTINENGSFVSPTFTVSGGAQPYTVSGSSDNTTLVPNANIVFTGSSPTWSVKVTPAALTSGTANISIIAKDKNSKTATMKFLLTVKAVNQAPTINAISNFTIPQNAAVQTVNLSGIGMGIGDTGQTLTVTAASSNTALIPNPTVTYTSPNATGTLTFTPVANTSGTSTITVTVKDNGGTANGGVDTKTTSFIVTVSAINQAPTINPISNPAAILESATPSLQTVNLSGIGIGANDTGQTLTVLATSSNTALIPNPTVTYTSPNATGSLSYTPVAYKSGTATITVMVKDNGGTLNGGVDTTTTTFVVTVTAVNQAPTIDTLANLTILQNAALRTVNLSGIGMGLGDSGQTLTVTAASSNTALIPNPTVTYTSPNATGILTFTPVANTSGTSTITVTVKDNGGTANGGVDTKTTSFIVTVSAVNQPPTLDVISNMTINEDAAQQTVNLTGIGIGTGDTGQTLIVTASSNNTLLIPNPIVTYTSPNTTGTLKFTPVAYQYGTATITVTVNDGQSINNITTRTFVVTVTAVNHQPTMDPIGNMTILQNAVQQTVNLTGISIGPGDAGQTLVVTASSSNTGLIPNPTVTYTSPNATGTLTFTPVTNISGVATITVTVKDSGGIANGGIDTIVRAFTVTVSGGNIPPTAYNGSLTVNINTPASGTLVCTDPDTAVVYSGIMTNGSKGVATLTNSLTGAYTYTPNANVSGTDSFTFACNDGTSNSNIATIAITITQVNQAPTIDPIVDMTILEDAAQQTVTLTGITVGPPNEAGQPLTVTASSSNVTVIPIPTVTYTSPSATGTLTFAPVANMNGTSTITVTVNDGQSMNNTTSRSFMVTVTAVNDAPTLDAIPNLTLQQNATQQTVNLSGITVGPANEVGQTLIVTATSSDTTLIPTPTVTYTSPNVTGTLTFMPVVGASGTVTIMVTVKDSGGTINGGVDTITRAFTVTLTSSGAINHAPTLDAISNMAMLEDAALQTATLTGITTGAGDTGQTLTVTAVSDNTGLIPNPTVIYSNPNTTGALSFVPVANMNGTANITVTVKDNGGTLNGGVDTTTRTFTVAVTAVNDAPTLNPIANLTITQTAPLQTVAFFGITPGPSNEVGQTLTVTATSSNTALIPTPTVTYTSPQSSGTLTFAPVANASGTATITVKVQDNGGTVNGGIDTIVRTFTVSVLAGSTPPTAYNGTLTVNENTSGSGTLVCTDPDSAQVYSGIMVNGSKGVATVTNSLTGAYTYTANPNVSGTDLFTFACNDGTSNSNIATITITINQVNQQPTLNPISSMSLNMNAPAQTVQLFGISAGAGDTGQTLTVTAISSNTALIPTPIVTYTSPQAAGTLTFTPLANASGTATITVAVKDNGGTVNGGNDTITQTFTVTVNAVNQQPTMDPIGTMTILQNAVQQTVYLTGIGMGPGDAGQTLVVTASSSNTGLIPNPTVTYTSPQATGTLTFTPVTNVSGTATITVTVKDSGGVLNGGIDTTVRTFMVLVGAVNQAPTLDALSNLTINEDAAQQTVNLTGISMGPGETAQTLTVTASSNNAAIIPNPTVNYISPNAIGTLTFTPVASLNGTATITVTVNDGQSMNNTTSRSFVVTVTAVNDAPTLDMISNLTIIQNAPLQTVNLTGISVGPANEAGQTLTVSATSSNTTLIPTPTVTYTSPNVTGTLTFAPVANASGTATITVMVKDSGGTLNGGNDTTLRSFTVTVTGTVNHAPTLNAIANFTILENAATQTIAMTGIGMGPGDTGQTLAVTASSSNTALIPNPSVTYTSPNATATLSFVPVANVSGTSTITVTVKDNGGTANGGVDTFTRTFTVSVVAVNQQPTLDPINNLGSLGTAPFQVNLTGISMGIGDVGQALVVTANSSNTAVLPNSVVTYTSPQATATLTFTPVANASGTSTITVTVKDSGGTLNGGNDTVARTFIVTVTAVNHAPTLDALSNLTYQGTAMFQRTITGITMGAGDSGQTLTVTATSSNSALIPDPQVVYTSPNTTGNLNFTPVANASGVTTITVTVKDNGGTANGGIDTTVQSFTIAVSSPSVITLYTLADAAVTSNPVLNIAGSATNSVGINTIDVNGDLAVFNTADGSFSQPLILVAGTNTFGVTAYDSLGVPTTVVRTVTLDLSAPTLAITTPADNSVSSVSTVTVAGNTADNSTVTVKVNGGSETAATMTGTAFTADKYLVPGMNVLEIKTTDLAGNSSIQKRTVLFDDQKPTVSITDPNQDIATSQTSILLKGSVANNLTNVTVTISVDGQTFTPALVGGLFEQTITLSSSVNKIYRVLVTVADDAGKQTVVQRNIVYTP